MWIHKLIDRKGKKATFAMFHFKQLLAWLEMPDKKGIICWHAYDLEIYLILVVELL